MSDQLRISLITCCFLQESTEQAQTLALFKNMRKISYVVQKRYDFNKCSGSSDIKCAVDWRVTFCLIKAMMDLIIKTKIMTSNL